MDIYNKPPLDVYLRHYNKPFLDECLAHHGILGQKWGVRNGPPYPLDAKSHSASEKKAGWQKSLNKGISNKWHSDKQGIILKADVNRGMKIVGSVLEKIGSEDLNSPMIQRLSANGREISNAQVKKSAALNRKDKDFSFTEDLSAVNPNFDPNVRKATIWNTNCGHCVSAYEFRKRGFDVTATPVTEREMKQGGIPSTEYQEIFPELSFKQIGSSSAIIQKILLGATYTSVSQKEYTNLCDQLETFGDGARGFVMGFGRFGGGHIFSWEVNNGSVRFMDAQNNNTDASGYFRDGRFASGSIEYARVDNLKLNEQIMSRYATNRR